MKVYAKQFKVRMLIELPDGAEGVSSSGPVPGTGIRLNVPGGVWVGKVKTSVLLHAIIDSAAHVVTVEPTSGGPVYTGDTQCLFTSTIDSSFVISIEDSDIIKVSGMSGDARTIDEYRLWARVPLARLTDVPDECYQDMLSVAETAESAMADIRKVCGSSGVSAFWEERLFGRTSDVWENIVQLSPAETTPGVIKLLVHNQECGNQVAVKILLAIWMWLTTEARLVHALSFYELTEAQLECGFAMLPDTPVE